MGDFERTFGAGANVDSIIDGFNRDYLHEQRQSQREYHSTSKRKFSSFQEALAWSKKNPGKTITRSPDGIGFIKK